MICVHYIFTEKVLISILKKYFELNIDFTIYEKHTV